MCILALFVKVRWHRKQSSTREILSSPKSSTDTHLMTSTLCLSIKSFIASPLLNPQLFKNTKKITSEVSGSIQACRRKERFSYFLCVPFGFRARACKLKITFYKPPCSYVLCQTGERGEKKGRATKGARAPQENSGSQPERDTNVGVQVDGKGPRTRCYSTSYDAASAADTKKLKYIYIVRQQGSKQDISLVATRVLGEWVERSSHCSAPLTVMLDFRLQSQASRSTITVRGRMEFSYCPPFKCMSKTHRKWPLFFTSVHSVCTLPVSAQLC